MTSQLGPNHEKWLNVILSYKNDPSKFDLTDSMFGLPEIETNNNGLKTIAQHTWGNIDTKTTNPYDKLNEIMPFWITFLLPRRPAIVYLSVWFKEFHKKSKSEYGDLMITFQELIQNFIREELLLFRIIKPFRRKLGKSILTEGANPEHQVDTKYNNYIEKFSSPQNVLDELAKFVKEKPLRMGIVYLLMIEKFSVILSKINSDKQFIQTIESFQNDLEKLENLNVRPKSVKPISQKEALKEPIRNKFVKTISPQVKTEKIITFNKIKLKEFDGYVHISGFSKDENRNFRIMNCSEEDSLREEMWRERKPKIRKLVNDLFQEKYSNSKKTYKLKRGVVISLENPNWLT